ncbi:DNA-J related domain-containing protein [Alteromonas sp. KUL106]|uniref:DNA-J related domain-containing protein n=1 Tax=Alteromonas sp. KUL106 TaxID=2480799 RepID=UPI0012E5C059|nr:DNA-J related domain-containing protein [Alteromonas sp. KUL106]GFD68908.1 hypothetical protein KUL106_21710 [Alteromonas sp. KUL106]
MQSNTDKESLGTQQADLLLDILSTQKALFTEGISEYSLIELLKGPPYAFFDDDALRDPLMLFKTHFVLFHVLYKLKRYWREANEGELDIHTLSIKLAPVTALEKASDNDAVQGEQLKAADALADYYLNWSNFERADRHSVDILLDAFWQKMAGGTLAVFQPEDVEEAHRLLGVSEEENMSLSSLKRAYKKTLQLVHPDKGGNQEDAQKVIHSYQMLLKYYSLK